MNYSYTPEEKELVQAMMTYWTNFAAYRFEISYKNWMFMVQKSWNI